MQSNIWLRPVVSQDLTPAFLEDDVKQHVDPCVWEEQVGLLEMTLDVDQIKRAAETFPGRDGG